MFGNYLVSLAAVLLIALTTQAKTIQQYFDPEVTFLALARGNVLAVYDQTHGSLSWNVSRPTGYGAVPGSRPPPLGHGADLVQASAWRGRWMDGIGSYQIGLRAYLPDSGTWASPDPLGHAGSDNLRSFCSGDTINIWDADGRVGAWMYEDREGWGVYYTYKLGGDRRGSFEARINLLTGLAAAGVDTWALYGGQRKSFGAQVGEFAANNFLNAEPIREAWQEVRHPDFSSGWGWAAFGVGIVSLVANTADVAGNALTLGTKGAAEGGAKAGLKEVLEVGAKEAAAPLLSRTTGEAMSPALFQRIQGAFERQPGRIMAADADSTAHLNRLGRNVEGETLNANVIALRENPGTAAVYEELIHTAQLRRGMTDVTQMEIEAAQKLLCFADRYGMSASERQQTLNRLNQLLQQKR